MDNFLDKYYLLKLKSRQDKQIKHTITAEELKTVIKHLPTKIKSPGLCGIYPKDAQLCHKDVLNYVHSSFVCHSQNLETT